MAKFSNDVDILKYEPNLFIELHPYWQVLASGTGGVVSGTTFTASSADFVNASVSSGCVVYLRSEDGSLDSCFEIVSVDSATQLTVSVLRADSADSAVAPPAATSVTYRISTFGPQVAEAGFALTEYFGIAPGNPASDVEVADILDTDVLRRASVFSVLAGVYAMLTSREDSENFWKKSMHYQQLFDKARQRCRLSIDSDSDGVADITRLGASVRLVRD